MKTKLLVFPVAIGLLTLILSGCQIKQNAQTNANVEPIQKQVVKLGYFPNVTHAAALIGVNKGIYSQELGDNVDLQIKTFNAGPAEIEALFAGEIDLGFIGPSPAVNGYIKSKGEALKIISGAAADGASLILQPKLFEKFQNEGPKALIGKKIASPQQGNTQDISLRHYLKANGILDKVTIVPIANADQLTTFSQKEIDGAWAPEPWATRLIKEVSGIRAIDERDLWDNKDFCTTNVIVSAKFLSKHPDLVKKFLAGEIATIDWINANPAEAQTIANAEIEKLTGKKLNEEVLAEAWKKLNLTVDPLKSTVFTFADWAFEQGFLGESKPDLTSLYDLSFLNELTNKQY